MISDVKSSTRYRGWQESKDMLECLHGGEGLIATYATKETMDKLIASYKRGKY